MILDIFDPQKTIGQVRCEGNDCGDGDNRYGGVCDKDGCDFNPYRMGNESFYGSNGSVIDTTKKFTVVTQFSMFFSPTGSTQYLN